MKRAFITTITVWLLMLSTGGYGSSPVPADAFSNPGGHGVSGAVVDELAQPAWGELEHLSTQQVSDRLQVLRFNTPALTGQTQVRVLLPQNYDPSGKTRYPVLYLLHGASSTSASWTGAGGAEAMTADYPLIVVMPDGGFFGYYTDYWNYGTGGPPKYETYHLSQLVPWMDAHYPTVASRDGRAVAGNSMGGLGAMHYAAKRPDLFAAAASFSGAVDINLFVAPPVVDISAVVEGNHVPGAAFGPYLTQEVRWRGYNPVDLAENLRGLLLVLDVGGTPGDPVELAMNAMGTSLHNKLIQFGIGHTWNDYGLGCHCWYYFKRDLRELLPVLMQRFDNPQPPPTPFSYRSIESSYSVYGWQVSIDRPAVEFSRLSDAGPRGFALTGSGRAQVVTAPLFDPGQPVTVTVADAAGMASVDLAADPAGRLTVPVSLGAGNATQQYPPLGTVVGGVTGLLNGGEPLALGTVLADVTGLPLNGGEALTLGPVTALLNGSEQPAVTALAAFDPAGSR